MGNGYQGYHGTNIELSDLILSEGRFLLSDNAGDWLGIGAYFFEDAPLRAQMWAESRFGEANGPKTAVLAAEIERETCLNLLDVQWWPHVIRAHEALAVAMESNKTRRLSQKSPILERYDGKHFMFFSGEPTVERSGNNVLDAAVIKSLLVLLKRSGLEFKSIRCAFIEGSELYHTSYFFDRYHVQIVVFDHSAIRSVARVLPKGD